MLEVSACANGAIISTVRNVSTAKTITKIPNVGVSVRRVAPVGLLAEILGRAPHDQPRNESVQDRAPNIKIV